MVIRDVYAQALFDLAKESGKLDLVFSQLKFMVDNVFNRVDFVEVMSNPNVDFEKKVCIVRKVFVDTDVLLINFLIILLKKNRFCLVNSVAKMFFDMYFDFKNIVHAKIISAVKLSDEILSELSKDLSLKYSASVIVENLIDENVIGGYIIKVGETVIDMSIRSRLDAMKKKIYLINW